MHRLYFKLIVLASVVSCTSMVYADDKDSVAWSEQNIDEVVVVAKAKARQLQHEAYAVSVVDLNKKYAAVTPLDKVLNTVSSVRIREDGGVGSSYTFSMNGFSGNQVKFFLDGVPMDNFGASFNIANLSANIAEQVEVYKGVLPIHLGSDALGGAVNIISRKKANYLDATYSIGSFGTHKVSINGAYTNLKNGFTVRANTFFNTSRNNYKVYAPIVDLNTGEHLGDEWVKRFNDRYVSEGLKLETGVVGRTWADQFLVGIIASGNNKHIQTGATMDAVYGRVKSRSFSLIPSLRYKKTNIFIPGLDISLYSTYSIVNTHNVDTANVTYNWHGDYVHNADNSRGEGYLTNALIKERQWQGNINLNYVINSHHSVMLNHIASNMRRKQSDTERPDYVMNDVPQILTKNITGLSYQVRFNKWNANIFGKSYRLHTSTHKLIDQFLSTEHYDKVGSNSHSMGYGAAMTYFILPSLQIKASYEQAYRMPESIEIFGDGFIQKANPDLKPEKSKNLNLGLLFDMQINDDHRLMAEVNYLYRHTKDFILKGVSLTSDPTTSYENIGKAVTNGIEASMQYHYKNIFTIGGNLTYQDIKDRQKTESTNNSYIDNGVTENITYGQRMPNIPYFFVNGDVAYNLHNIGHRGNTLTLGYNCDYIYKYYLSFPGLGRPTSKKYIPTQFSHSASLSYLMAGGKYSISLDLENITNEKLYDNYRLQKPGRSVEAKFRVFLSKI